MILCTALAAAFAVAQPGSTIAVTGTCDAPVVLAGRSFAPPVTIDAAAARFTAPLSISHVDGLKLVGGWHGPISYRAGTGITVADSQHVTVTRQYFVDSDRAVGIDNSTDVTVSLSKIERMRVDGIDILPGSRRILIDRNTIEGSVQVDAQHPDCVQGWSRPGMIVSDVIVSGNKCSGHTQGFTFFNHARPNAAGVMTDDGGFDRIVITGNTGDVTEPVAIALYECRGACAVSGNHAIYHDHVNRIVVEGATGWTLGVNDTAAVKP